MLQSQLYKKVKVLLIQAMVAVRESGCCLNSGLLSLAIRDCSTLVSVHRARSKIIYFLGKKKEKNRLQKNLLKCEKN